MAQGEAQAEPWVAPPNKLSPVGTNESIGVHWRAPSGTGRSATSRAQPHMPESSPVCVWRKQLPLANAEGTQPETKPKEQGVRDSESARRIDVP